MFLIVFYVILFIVDITGQFPSCDDNHPCPANMACRYMSEYPGMKSCVLDKTVARQTKKRSGRCPTNFNSQSTANAKPCTSHSECPTDKRCCPLIFGGTSMCMNQERSGPQPSVISLVQGSATMNGPVMYFVGSSTLIQSKGFNMLVDTGTQKKKTELLRGLWQYAGLTPEDIDWVITTHGHPDHYSNDQTFSDTAFIYNTYMYNGSEFMPNPLGDNPPRRFFLNNDPNTEVIKTPGHTSQSISVIVRNVPAYGTIGVVGDLFLYRNDGIDPFAYDQVISNQSRKSVACMVDYILPGHGPLYKVDSQLKLNCPATG